MKLCPTCDQPIAEEITTCPSCGSEIGEGRKYIDDYRIVDVLHEGHASFLCRAIRERTNEHVMIRLFTLQSGVNEEVASRLKRELEELKKLPAEGFVRHHAIRRSLDGLWYRISEWIDTESWGSLLASGRFGDHQVAFDLFYKMASILAVLHNEGYFIPHLILNDIILVKGGKEDLEVKIDYKLSRFFDPKLDRPGPMLKRLLNCHPDIINKRPLDFRSDIWSLGKIFVELLSADLEATDFLGKVEELDLPPEAEVLFKVMLADDPDLRPRSMAEVAESLARIRESLIQKVGDYPPDLTVAPTRTIKGLQKKISLLATVVVLLLVAGVLAWFQLGHKKKDTAAVLEGYANQYAPSVAFLLVEYWLEADNKTVYRNRAEGTAFLVDKDGYLLTSRHVACPWLEDSTLFATVYNLRQENLTPRFRYRMFLWFEGQRAFNRVAHLIESTELADVYFVETAFSTGSEPRLSIAGVAKTPVRTRQVIISPLKDDFAVLKIDRVPDGRIPLPLHLKINTKNIPKLSPVITLGFPLGSRAQEARVNVSVTNGYVRRSFENLIQVDASFYSGSSGGPIIDISGKVIGIVSGVSIDWAQGLLPVVSPRWDMGMVLPVTKAVGFLNELKGGRVKWNGVMDLSVETTLQKIVESAKQGRWAEAVTLADKKLKISLQPPLVMAAGMMHFCSGDNQAAKQLFSQSLSMDAENHQAKLMLFLIDWLAGHNQDSLYRQDLLALDWRSPGEFQGYLIRVLEGLVDEASALKGWYSQSEKSWLYYMVGLIRYQRKDWDDSERLLRHAVLAADPDDWVFFLARARLEQLQKQRREPLQTKDQWTEYNADIDNFDQDVQKTLAAKESRQAEMLPLMIKLSQDTTSMKDSLKVLEKILELDPDNHNILAGLAFYCAADEAWTQALEYTRNFLSWEGRQNARRLSIGLLEPGILHYQGFEAEARAGLLAYGRRIRDPWYLTISEYLLGKQTEDSLKNQVGESPENLITAHIALGFWAEGAKDKKKAAKHYKEALESFLDTWLEYDFARERLKRLKKPSE
jgi:S1-C subfamily serine protease